MHEVRKLVDRGGGLDDLRSCSPSSPIPHVSSKPRRRRTRRRLSAGRRLHAFPRRGRARTARTSPQPHPRRHVHRRHCHGRARLRRSNIIRPSSTIRTTAAAGRSMHGRPSCWCRSPPASSLAAIAGFTTFLFECGLPRLSSSAVRSRGFRAREPGPLRTRGRAARPMTTRCGTRWSFSAPRAPSRCARSET